MILGSLWCNCGLRYSRSEAASRVWTRQASPDTDVTPVGRTVDFQQLKAAVLRAKLEGCRDGECEGSPQSQCEDDEEESAVAVHRIAMAARRYATGSPSDSEEDDPETVRRLCAAVRGLAKGH